MARPLTRNRFRALVLATQLLIIPACSDSAPTAPSAPSKCSSASRRIGIDHRSAGCSRHHRLEHGSVRRGILPDGWPYLPLGVAGSRAKSEPGPDSERVRAALDYWQSEAGMAYTLVESDNLPRVLIRFGTDGLAAWGGGRSLVDGTYSDNRASPGSSYTSPVAAPIVRPAGQQDVPLPLSTRTRAHLRHLHQHT